MQRALGEDAREIGLDRRRSRRRHSEAKVAVGTDDTKRRLFAAKPRMGRASRIDQQVRGGSSPVCIARDDEGFDMRTEPVRDVAGRFHDYLTRLPSQYFAEQTQPLRLEKSDLAAQLFGGASVSSR